MIRWNLQLCASSLTNKQLILTLLKDQVNNYLLTVKGLFKYCVYQKALLLLCTKLLKLQKKPSGMSPHSSVDYAFSSLLTNVTPYFKNLCNDCYWWRLLKKACTSESY